jgi:tetratricopeptide (TPR) repeat protein
MSSDLQIIMGDWPYDPSAINARWIMGMDGKPKIQLRLDLGLLQMEISGRPDGTRPRGFTSLLDFFHDAEKHAPQKGAQIQFAPNDLAELQQEAVQYYYRYIALYAMRDLDRVVQDTEHNLKLIEMVSRNAESADVAWQFIQFFPYVRMMNARSRAERLADKKAYDEAIKTVDTAIGEIQKFWQEHDDRREGENATREIEMLYDLLDDLQQVRPKTEVDVLKEQLDRAIAIEDYEKAAALRDKIAQLTPPANHTQAGL